MNPEDWTTAELFNWLVERELLDDTAEFEDWKNDRTALIETVKEFI